MTYKPTFKILVLAACACAVPAATAAYPDLKPGLWETVKHDLNSGKTEHSKTCIDQKYLAFMREMSEGAHKNPNRPCKVVSTTKVGSTYTSEMECTHGSSVMRSKTVGTYSPEHYHTSTHQEGGAGMASGARDSETDMNYAGACPAGMQDGDMIMPDGTKTNFLKIMGSTGAH